MKPHLLLLLILLTFTSCIHDYDEYDYSNYHAVLMTRAQLEKSIVWQSPREPINPGKIYYKDQFIYINEKFKGVHVIDNHDPSSPENIGFIQAPGNVDIAIKGNAMYLDNAVDLIAIDISDIKNPKVTHREKEVFPELTPPDTPYIPGKFSAGQRPENTVIVGWEKKGHN